jgi:hypothetical protein
MTKPDTVRKRFRKGNLMVIDRENGKKVGQHRAVPGEMVELSAANYEICKHCFDPEPKPKAEPEEKEKASK